MVNLLNESGTDTQQGILGPGINPIDSTTID